MSFPFTIYSPTVRFWLETIISQRGRLLNPRPQMTVLLGAVQDDIDKQFDENQGKWTPLADFTVAKKVRNQADPRILHETKEGQGLRLREAYREAGEVTSDGKIIYSYPESKPYARELQEGIQGDKKSPKKRKLSPSLAREMRRLDKEYEDLFGRD